MRVLVVDDDPNLGGFLKTVITREGFDVDLVGDGEAALSLARLYSPDLIILDLGLPKLDGTEVLANLRAQGVTSSVLVITGRNDMAARVNCLDLGADDCVLKPFGLAEVMARIRGILRRRVQSQSMIVRYEELELNRLTRRATWAGQSLELTGKEFALLDYLFSKRGKCVSRAELLSHVWEQPMGSETNVVDVYINYLRRKLAASSQNKLSYLIETVRGSGYRVALARPGGHLPRETVYGRRFAGAVLCGSA